MKKVLKCLNPYEVKKANSVVEKKAEELCCRAWQDCSTGKIELDPLLAARNTKE